MISGGVVRSVEDFQEWLSESVARLAERPRRDIGPDVPIAEYGLDSVSALTVVVEAEEQFGIELDPADLWDYPTVCALSRRILELVESAAR